MGNENLSYEEVFNKMATVLGVPPPKWNIPKWVLISLGRCFSFIAFVTGIKPVISYQLAKVACDNHYFSSDKAIKELDLSQTPIEDGIRESFNWLQTNGYIKI